MYPRIAPLLVLLASLFACPGYGFVAVQPNCSIPDDNVSFVGGVPIRSSMQIFWAAMATLLLCTWTIQHPSVPLHDELEEPKEKGRFGKWASGLLAKIGRGLASVLRLFRKEKGKPEPPEEPKEASWKRGVREETIRHWERLQWTFLSVLFPEYIFGKSLAEMLAASYSKHRFSHRNWTRTHAFFANMRGFVLRFEVAAARTPKYSRSATSLGNALNEPTEGGEVAYQEQDVELARWIEFEHCQKYCGKPCPYRVPQPDDSPVVVHSSPRINQLPLEDGLNIQRLPDVATSYRDAQTPTMHPGPPSRIDSASTAPWSPSQDSEATLLTAQNTPLIPLSPLNLRTNFTQAVRPGNSVGTASMTADMIRPVTTIELSEMSEADIVRVAKEQNNFMKRPPLHAHTMETRTWALSAIQFHYAYEQGILGEDPPAITAEELRERSKADVLVKLGTLIQIGWMVIQVVVRGGEGLSIPPLEISVLASAACALFTWSFFLRKPQDVRLPVVVDAKKPLTREHVIGLAARAPKSSLIAREIWLHGVAVRIIGDNVFPYSPGVPFFIPRLMRRPVYLNVVLIGIGFGGSLFGGIHAISWNFEFPHPVEQLLWRVSCSILTVFPLGGAILYSGSQHFLKKYRTSDNFANRMMKPILYSFASFYLLARFYLLVEVFRTLAFLPQSAFQTVAWPSFIPYIN